MRCARYYARLTREASRIVRGRKRRQKIVSNAINAAATRAYEKGASETRGFLLTNLGIKETEIEWARGLIEARRNPQKMRWVATAIVRQHFISSAMKVASLAVIAKEPAKVSLFPPTTADIEQATKVLEISLDCVQQRDAETTLSLAE